jgi:hypothetical protein
MQYMILIHMDERRWDQVPQGEREQLKADTDRLVEDLGRTGHLRSAAVLRGSRTAKSLRQNEGKLSVIDGPFTEAKEVLAGYQLVECKDIDEAISIAARFPGLKAGLTVEVRPLTEDCSELRTAAKAAS